MAALYGTVRLQVIEGIKLVSVVVDTMTSQNLYGKCIQDFENTMFPAILRKKDAYMSGALKVFLSLFRQESVFPSSLLIPDPGKEDVL